jgi:hypothetical protein
MSYQNYHIKYELNERTSQVTEYKSTKESIIIKGKYTECKIERKGVKTM